MIKHESPVIIIEDHLMSLQIHAIITITFVQHPPVKLLEELGKSSRRKQRSFEEKETYQWYKAMKAVNKQLGDKIKKYM